jgi:hypothetical protein
MRVLDVHERPMNATPEEVGALIDSLAAPADGLWPGESWPRMHLKRPLRFGAVGGLGPVRHAVEAYAPGRSIKFRFLRPKGFVGFHAYEVLGSPGRAVVLRHTLQMSAQGLAAVCWPLVFRPLHDALMEDSLAKAAASLGGSPGPRPWSPWVRFLRWTLLRGKAGPQAAPAPPPRKQHGSQARHWRALEDSPKIMGQG